jgi:hypothetical protein
VRVYKCCGVHQVLCGACVFFHSFFGHLVFGRGREVAGRSGTGERKGGQAKTYIKAKLHSNFCFLLCAARMRGSSSASKKKQGGGEEWK